MKTEAEKVTAPAPAGAEAFIVTAGGVPCALVCLTGKKRGTALLPGAPITIFRTRRRARSAIARTRKMAERLRGSLLEDWPKLRALFSGAEYKIERAGVQI